jgi:mRNA interferase RelE/StbE
MVAPQTGELRSSWRSTSQSGGVEIVSDLAVESTPDVAAAADQAARGQVVYITEHGNRVAGIVPVELAAILERITSDELDQLAAAADLAGLSNAAVLMEDLADRESVLESRAEPGTPVSWKQLNAEASRSPRVVTWREKASKHFGLLDNPVKERITETINKLAENPQPPGMKPVIGLPGVFRVREGHWRILYSLDDDRRTIWIEDVRHRRRVRGTH